MNKYEYNVINYLTCGRWRYQSGIDLYFRYTLLTVKYESRRLSTSSKVSGALPITLSENPPRLLKKELTEMSFSNVKPKSFQLFNDQYKQCFTCFLVKLMCSRRNFLNFDPLCFSLFLGLFAKLVCVLQENF